MLTRLLTLAALAAISIGGRAQQSMGTVPTHDALVTGGLEVRDESARLISNTAVTAYDHTATISLERGGTVLVCSTSQFHLLHSGTGESLLFGLDRGAFEIHSKSQAQDVIITPDIRFTLENPGIFDLRMRVTPSGDTCVDNAGAGAPVLLLTDPFSSAIYRLIPGQHVLFEHGSLHEVVDHERSSCGCPAAAPPVVLTANATAAERAAAEHPFPAAVSEGLAPALMAANGPPEGEKHTQVAVTLSNLGPPASAPVAAPAPPLAATSTSSEPPPSPPGAHDLVHAIGHFFHKLFHPKSDAAKTPTPAS
jgi:hypothetical protein